MKKIWMIALAAASLAGSSMSAQDVKLGYVNFKNCLEKSKSGRHERQSFESLKNQMQKSLEATDKELEEIAKQLEDQDYMDTLSPTAEEELKQKFAALSQELSRFQAQYYQMLNQANYKMIQSLHDKIALAAGHIREKENLSIILNEESAFAIAPGLDVTDKVVGEMDRLFDLENTEVAQTGKKGSIKNG